MEGQEDRPPQPPSHGPVMPVAVKDIHAEEAVCRERYAVQSAPHHIIERCAMPESGEEHGNHQVDIGAHLSLSVSSESEDIEIVSYPGRERDVRRCSR